MVFSSLEEAQKEIARLKRELNRQVRDNRMLARVTAHAERLRRHFEEEKKRQYLYNDLLITHCPNMIFLFNEEQRYMLGTSGCLQLTGRFQEDLLYQPFVDVFAEVADCTWVDRLHRENRKAYEKLVMYRYDDAVELRNGSELSIQVTVLPIIDENRECRGTVTSVSDVTELTRARRKAEVVAASRSRFLASMSHEIRTPMNAVLGLSELLLKSSLTPQHRSHVRDIHVSAASLLTLINDILDASKIESGKLGLLPRSYDFSALLENIASVVEFMAAEKGLDFYIEYPEKPPVCLYGDPERLRQVLLNLLTNAVKYTMSGYVRLAISLDAAHLFFDVEDSGIGIKKDVLPLLFDPYMQVGGEETRGIEGTGLGLNIAKRLSDLMKGELSVRSEYGKGSIFTLRIPYLLGNVDDLSPSGSPVTDQGQWAGRALVVDDNAINLNVAQGLLEYYGLACERAGSGAQAVGMAHNSRYDIIFMDHMMPGMNGLQACRAIRASAGNSSSTPIIALTANAMPETRDMLLHSGMDDFLAKPVQAAELCALLDRWLPRKEAACLYSPEANTPGKCGAGEILAAAQSVHGLDTALGLQRVCGMENLYADCLRTCASTITDSLSRMTVWLAEKNLQSLHIAVHGLKSAFANIGAMHLAGLAETLENAAANENFSVWDNRYPPFRRAAKNLATALEKLFVTHGGEHEKPVGDESVFARHAGVLREALAASDFYWVKSSLAALCAFEYDQKLNALVRQIERCASRFDYDAALAHLDEDFFATMGACEPGEMPGGE